MRGERRFNPSYYKSGDRMTDRKREEAWKGGRGTTGLLGQVTNYGTLGGSEVGGDIVRAPSVQGA